MDVHSIRMGLTCEGARPLSEEWLGSSFLLNETNGPESKQNKINKLCKDEHMNKVVIEIYLNFLKLFVSI